MPTGSDLRNVVHLHGYMDTASVLRDFATQVECGELGSEVTLVIDGEVYSLGVRDNPYEKAMWDLQTGAARLIEVWKSNNEV